MLGRAIANPAISEGRLFILLHGKKVKPLVLTQNLNLGFSPRQRPVRTLCIRRYLLLVMSHAILRVNLM